MLIPQCSCTPNVDTSSTLGWVKNKNRTSSRSNQVKKKEKCCERGTHKTIRGFTLQDLFFFFENIKQYEKVLKIVRASDLEF